MIAAATRARLVAIAKSLFFPERSYELVLDRARAEALPGAQLSALEAWLPAGRVDQKRADALAMLETMRGFLARDPAPARPGFAFEHTTLWERALAGARPVAVHDAEEMRVLEELRLEAARWDVLRHEVLRSLMAPAATEAAAAAPRRAADHGGKPPGVERVLEDAARMEAARRVRQDIPPAIVERQMLARLRATEEFGRLRARAEDKLARIAARRDLPGIEEFPDWKLLELRDWYFSRVLGEEMPDDLEQWVRARGYSDQVQFHQAIFTEFVYQEMTGAQKRRADTGE